MPRELLMILLPLVGLAGTGAGAACVAARGIIVVFCLPLALLRFGLLQRFEMSLDERKPLLVGLERGKTRLECKIAC